MYNGARRQSISEQRTSSFRSGLTCTPSRDEPSYSKFSKNDRRKKLLSTCEYLLRYQYPNNDQKHSSREPDKSSTLIKDVNDIESSEYWVSGEQFFQTSSKNLNESNESSKKQNSETFVQLFGDEDDDDDGDDNFRGHRHLRRVISNHSELDDTLIPTREKNDDNESGILKDVKTSSGRDEDFLRHFKLPFYRPELENDNKITNTKKRESSADLTNSTQFIPNTTNVYNNYIYLSLEHLLKLFNVTKLIKLLRRGERVGNIRRKTFKRANYKKKIPLVISRERKHSRRNVCEILTGIEKELSLIGQQNDLEALPNSTNSISILKARETLNELITKCKTYICNNNYREEAVTKMNDLLGKNIDDLEKVLKKEMLTLSKKNFRKTMEEQYSTSSELKSVKERDDDLQKTRISKNYDKQTLLNGGRKMVERRNKIKKLLNNMLLLIDDISVIEDNKENIKNHQRTINWDNTKRRYDNFRMESKKNRGDENVKLNTTKKVNQMENEINVESKFRVTPNSNTGKNKIINTTKNDKTLREKQNCSDKSIICQYKLIDNSSRTKKSTDTISNVSFGNKKEQIKNNGRGGGGGATAPLETVEMFKEKKARKVSPSIYSTYKHLERPKKHNDVRLNRQVNLQPVWKPAGAVKPFSSNPTFSNNESFHSRTQMLFNKDNQIIRRSIANPSEPTVSKRKNSLKDNQRNENLNEEHVNDLCELFAKTQITSKRLKCNRNLSNVSLMNVRGKNKELNLTKDKYESKSRRRRSSGPRNNTSQILFKDKQQDDDYEKNKKIKDQILDCLERNDNRNSSMNLFKISDDFPTIQSSTYQNKETEQTTKKEIEEKSSKEILNSSNKDIVKINDSNCSPNSVLENYQNLDCRTPIENQPSLISSLTNINYNVKLSSVFNLMTTTVTSSNCCEVSSISSSTSKTNMILNQFIEQNQSTEMDKKDSLQTLMVDDNCDENESDKVLGKFNDRFKQDSINSVSSISYPSLTNDTMKNPLNEVSIDTASNNNNNLDKKSMSLMKIENLPSEANESNNRMIDENKSQISQTLSNLKSFTDAFTNIDDIEFNCFKKYDNTIVSSSPNEIDLKVSSKDVAIEVISQDQTIQTQTDEQLSYKVMKDNSTDLNTNLTNDSDETDIAVNVESKLMSKENLDRNDKWVMDTVELYCEQPNDDVSKIIEKDQKENIDLINDRWVEDTVELYCEQPNDENEDIEEKRKLKKFIEMLDQIYKHNDKIRKSTLSETKNQLNTINEKLINADMQMNKVPTTVMQVFDDLSYTTTTTNTTTTPSLDSNSKEMIMSWNNLFESSNVNELKNDDKPSYEDLCKSVIEESLTSSHSLERSSRISNEPHFQFPDKDLNKMNDIVDDKLQKISPYSINFDEYVKINEDNSNDDRSMECRKILSTKLKSSSDGSLKILVDNVESIERDKHLSWEYFNKDYYHSCDNLNDFKDDNKDIIDIKSKLLSLEDILNEPNKPIIDHPLLNDKSGETNSSVSVLIQNSNNEEEKEMEIISEESKNSIFVNTDNSTENKVSSVLNLRGDNQGLKMIEYYKKDIPCTNLSNEEEVEVEVEVEEESNEFHDLVINRGELLLLIYFIVCSFVFFCLNFSIVCEPFI
ncbi:hypothetical protein M0802_013153 [Mischocyttarus mexicanus]|nr:hypothetical protein M0802_013153 [Mischocyttarus mexicanus]